MNFFTKRTFSILGTCLWALATAHAAEEIQERPSRPASARPRKITYRAEAEALWATWSKEFTGSKISLTGHAHEDPAAADDVSTADLTPQQAVLNRIETYWASLITQQLYRNHRAPIMPDDFKDDDERAEAEENFQNAMITYENNILTKARTQAQESVINLLTQPQHTRHRSSTGSFESDFSEISLSGEPIRRASNMSGNGADALALDDLHALKDGLFALADQVDALTAPQKAAQRPPQAEAPLQGGKGGKSSVPHTPRPGRKALNRAASTAV